MLSYGEKQRIRRPLDPFSELVRHVNHWRRLNHRPLLSERMVAMLYPVFARPHREQPLAPFHTRFDALMARLGKY